MPDGRGVEHPHLPHRLVCTDSRGNTASIVAVIKTTQQPGHPVTRWAKTVIRTFRNLNDELLGAGEAMTRSNRFPQPRPQADLAQARQVHPASSGKVLAGV